MAWRDSRRSRGRLLLFSTALTLGVAALVAIGTLGANLNRAIDEQARSLVGADLVLEGRQAPTPEQTAWERSLGGEQAHEIGLSSMAVLPRTGATRLVQVRALEGGYPFYGQVETEPADAAARFARGESGALVEESLLLQFNARPGTDTLDVGGRSFPILGALRKLPGETAAFSGIAPRVLIPRGQLPAGLTSRGSLVRYKTYVKDPAAATGRDGVPGLVTRIRPQLEKYDLEADSVARRQRSLGRVFENVSRFLSLVGFVSLLLGGIGVASAIHAHLKDKLRTVATLRCLGASGGQAMAVYLVQALAMGLAGAGAGAVAGLALGALIPRYLQDALPFALSGGFRPSWAAVGWGVGVGLATCALFALLPLLPVRRVAPLLALRSAYGGGDDDADAGQPRRRDPLRWLAYALLLSAVVAFPWAQSRDWRFGLAFSGGLLVSWALLAATGRGTMAAVRRFFPRSWPYEWRQGLANLYRPNNRTLLLVFTLGLSTFLLLGLYLVKEAMLRQFALKESTAGQPNVVFFDIQNDQREGVTDLVRAQGLPVLGTVPVVGMRLATIRGRPVNELAAERDAGSGKRTYPEWRLRHEYRSTYRDRLIETEELLAGRFTGRVEPNPANPDAPVPVSVEEDMAKELRLRVGDPLEFDVGGVPVAATVGSVRKVEWGRFQPNFFVVFPVGVLEQAPAFNVLVTRAPTPAAVAEVQGAMAKQFPTVSSFDLSLVVQTVQGIVDKATVAVRFLNGFTVGTGLLVLMAAVWTGRYERVRESVLLRTLGASRRQVFGILCVEYLLLGALAALTGIVLAAAGSWALATFVFKIAWVPSPLAVVIALGVVTTLTVTVGLLASRGVANEPPLAILREEG